MNILKRFLSSPNYYLDKIIRKLVRFIPNRLYLKWLFRLNVGYKLDLKYVSRTVNSKSPESNNYDFSVGDTFFVGNVEFRTRLFFCNGCQSCISFKDMKKYEKEKCKK